MFGWPVLPLTAITAAAPGLLLAWLIWRRNEPLLGPLGPVGWVWRSSACWASTPSVAKWCRTWNCVPYLDVAQQPTAVQWSPLLVFLALFAVGLGVVAWMVLQVVKAGRSD